MCDLQTVFLDTCFNMHFGFMGFDHWAEWSRIVEHMGYLRYEGTYGKITSQYYSPFHQLVGSQEWLVYSFAERQTASIHTNTEILLDIRAAGKDLSLELNNSWLAGPVPRDPIGIYIMLHMPPEFEFETMQPFSGSEDGSVFLMPGFVSHIQAKISAHERLPGSNERCTNSPDTLASWQVKINA